MAHREVSELTTIQTPHGDATVPPLVYAAAAGFFAAYITTEKVTNENEPAMLEKAVTQALDLALTTEKIVTSSENKAPL